MARSNKNMASFSFSEAGEIPKRLEEEKVNGSVDLSAKEKEHVNKHVNVHVKENKKVSIETNILDDVIENKKKNRLDDLAQTGIYFERDVFEVLMRLAKKGGRGAKSSIVNEALKGVFKQKGLM